MCGVYGVCMRGVVSWTVSSEESRVRARVIVEIIELLGSGSVTM
jgi:hypothetical protein